jgi:hypothetical protein
MATYALQGPSHAGGTIATQTAASGDLCPTGQGVALFVIAGTAANTITLPVVPTYDGLSVTSRTFTLPANQYALIPVPDSVYGVGTTVVNYANVLTALAGAIRIP